MICKNPECRSENISVLHTYKDFSEDIILRYRICNDCQTVWKSYENSDLKSVKIPNKDELSLFENNKKNGTN